MSSVLAQHNAQGC